VFKKPYEVPYRIRDDVSAELNKMVKENILEPIRYSQWASPIVVVPKKTGGIRICVDYKRTVNPNVETDVYPLPRIDDLLASLSTSTVFTALDLTNAYGQIELTEESKQILVLNTHQGLYKMNRLPFGVSSAPSIFQSIMDNILSGLQGVVCYLDDILIGGTDEQDCKQKVDEVLTRLAQSSRCTRCVPVTHEKTVYFLINITTVVHTLFVQVVFDDLYSVLNTSV
jgi:hypothetical protein